MHAARPTGERLIVAHGDALGYDKMAGRWAKNRAVECLDFPVSSRLDGHRDDAPKRRNQRMYDDFKPDACLAFPGGAGTRHMFSICRDAGLPVYDVAIDADNRKVSIWLCKKGKPGLLYREGLFE